MQQIVKLLNDHALAELCGFGVETVRRWRLRGQGPRFIKIGAMVRYRASDVQAWLESRPCGGGEPIQKEESQVVMAAT